MIRTAVVSDLGGIARLNRFVHELHAQNVPSRFKHPKGTDEFLSWFTPVLHEHDSFVIVADVSDVVVGYLYAKEVKKEESWIRPHSNFFMLHHIAVAPKFQKGGIGSQLLDALFEEGERRGIPKVELDVWTFNENAKRFFTRFGFTAFNQRMDVTINQRSNQAEHSTPRGCRLSS